MSRDQNDQIPFAKETGSFAVSAVKDTASSAFNILKSPFVLSLLIPYLIKITSGKLKEANLISENTRAGVNNAVSLGSDLYAISAAWTFIVSNRVTFVQSAKDASSFAVSAAASAITWTASLPSLAIQSPIFLSFLIPHLCSIPFRATHQLKERDVISEHTASKINNTLGLGLNLYATVSSLTWMTTALMSSNPLVVPFIAGFHGYSVYHRGKAALTNTKALVPGLTLFNLIPANRNAEAAPAPQAAPIVAPAI